MCVLPARKQSLKSFPEDGTFAVGPEGYPGRGERTPQAETRVQSRMAGSGVTRLVLSRAQSAPAWVGDTEAGSDSEGPGGLWGETPRGL